MRTNEILNELYAIANDYSSVAIIWHAVFYILFILLLTIWKPSNRLFSILICLPLLSVAVIAWISGNPFNGLLFSVLAILILLSGLSASKESISFTLFPSGVIGILMIAFGLVYPHFIETNSIIKYLYASPVGIIPCPTLSVLIGIVLLFKGFGSQPIIIVLIIAGLFYGFVGLIKLNVKLDLFLLFGTIYLIADYVFFLRTHNI
jgi:hypothetical protein